MTAADICGVRCPKLACAIVSSLTEVAPENSTGRQEVFHRLTGDADEQKATSVFRGAEGKGAPETLRGDRTLQEIAARHQFHPSQVGEWKR